MSVTTVSTNDSSTKKLWAEKFFRKIGFATITQTLMGEDNAPIAVKRELQKGEGDRVRFHILNEMGGEFIDGTSNLEGQEQKLSWGYQNITLEEKKIGVRTRKGIDEKRTIFPIPKIAEERLRLRVAKNLDRYWFKKMYSGTLTKTLYAGAATSTATLAATDTLTHQLCSKAKWGALSGWQAADDTVAQEPLKPVMVDGEEHLILLVHPYAVYDLSQSAAYQQMLREAAERGKSNPLFRGAGTIVLDNVIVKTSNYVKIQQNAAGVWYCRGLLLGQMASCWAWGELLEIVNKAFGYREEEGWGAKLIFDTVRTTFTDSTSGTTQDYGCAEVDIAITNLGL